MKYKHYVALVYSRSITWVTRVSNQSRTAYWEDNKPAREFTMHEAQDLVYGLCVNGYPAMVIKAPDFMNPFNLVETEGDDQ